ncbi:MAG: hypothetical protein HRT92_00710 [Piscirickettsiaceae bacterium]|nr:hypothetical protein [Piscirickettsiaceae bacterium]
MKLVSTLGLTLFILDQSHAAQYVFPENGQSAEQQISSTQQGKQADYFRARAACLEAKGYSVK